MLCSVKTWVLWNSRTVFDIPVWQTEIINTVLELHNTQILRTCLLCTSGRYMLVVAEHNAPQCKWTTYIWVTWRSTIVTGLFELLLQPVLRIGCMPSVTCCVGVADNSTYKCYQVSSSLSIVAAKCKANTKKIHKTKNWSLEQWIIV
jgi:hypothetical protein